MQNDSGGALSLQMYCCETTVTGMTTYFIWLKALFYDTHSKLQATKAFSLRIEQGADRDSAESLFCSVTFWWFISRATSSERIKLCRVPPKTLFFHLESLHKGLYVTPSPSLQQIQIETAPLFFAKPLLERVDVLLRKRNDSRVPRVPLRVDRHEGELREDYPDG